jgi:hypothetical protein
VRTGGGASFRLLDAEMGRGSGLEVLGGGGAAAAAAAADAFASFLDVVDSWDLLRLS